ncbi:MAG TPA: dCTP deaminase [Gammaproteobacteria bacterium]|nr:dCTP deaminase [Gammaproteobacteria bacterium]
MVLTGESIATYMDKTDISHRLFVTPSVNRTRMLGASSLDVRLGNQFIVFRKHTLPYLDAENLTPQAVRAVQERRIVEYFQEGITLHPNELVIGSTLEYVSLPPGLMCYVASKSGWGRMGLVIATAPKVDPGFAGCITLELLNAGQVPLKLYAGYPIAQLIFHRCDSEQVYKGAYNCPVGPEFPKLSPKEGEAKFWARAK